MHLIIGFPPGGTADVTARLIGQWLSERLGQTFVVESRPGAGTNTATEVVVNAPPDGYTLLFASTANAINTTLYAKLNFNFIRDVVPIAGLDREPNIMVVNPSFLAKSVPEFIAHAKANPGKINMASSAIGTSAHLAGELFKATTGVDILNVPYRGMAPALTALLGDQVQVMFANEPASIEYIKAGTLRALAVTSSTRSEALPDIPTVGDFVPGYEASAFNGLWRAQGHTTRDYRQAE